MDFIHTSWNNNLSSAEFQQLFLEQKDKLLIIHKLFELIGYFSENEKFGFGNIFFQDQIKTQFSILYEYLFVSISSSPQFFIDSIVDPPSQNHLNQNLNILGLIRFFSQYGDQLFEIYRDSDFNIDIKEYSYCCLIALQTCLLFGFDKYSLVNSDFNKNDIDYLNSYEFYISEISISKLSSSLSFNIQIAHSRLYYKNEIISTRDMFQKRILLTSRKLYYFFKPAEEEENDDNNDLFLGNFYSDISNADEDDRSEMFLTLNGLYTWKYLKFIILSNQPFIENKISLLPRCEVLLFVISDLLVIHNNPCLFEFSSIEDLYNAYLHVISQFFAIPSLYLAFMVTAYFAQYMSFFESKTLHKARDAAILSTYSAQNFHNLLKNIKKMSKQKILRKNEVPEEEVSDNDNSEDVDQRSSFRNFCHPPEIAAFIKHYDDRYFTYDCISSFDDLETYLSKEPNYDENTTQIIYSFYDSIFEYPAFASSVISSFLYTLQQEDFEKCSHISRQILRSYHNLQDFRIYIFKRGNFFSFIMNLFRVSSLTDKEELFYPIWLLALTLMRFTWGGGTAGIYKRFIVFVDTIEPFPIRYLLRILLQIDPEKEDLLMARDSDFLTDQAQIKQDSLDPNDLLGFSKFYPFYIASRTLNYLIAGKFKLLDVCQYLPEHPYLWISCLLYVYCQPTIENRDILIKEKQPNEVLFDLLFKQVMLKTMDENSKKWLAASEMFDLMIFNENLPSMPTDISTILTNHIKIIIIPDILRYSKIVGICNAWNALSVRFGFDVFINVFLHEMLNTMTSIQGGYSGFDTFEIEQPDFRCSTINSPLEMFINSIGHLFGVFCNYDQNRIKITINFLINIIDNEGEFFNNSDISYAFAQFTVILINDANEDLWKEIFIIIIDKCKSIIKSHIESSSKDKIVMLALSLIRIALIIPKFRKIMINDDDLYHILYDMNDFPSVIDLLIAKDIYTDDHDT